MSANGRRIAVVGAGVAGLSCARQLQRAGLEVRVFDKSRGVGGRAATRRAEPLAFDHGAQYFTARDPEFRLTVAEWCREGVVAPWQARVRTLERGTLGEPANDTLRYVGVPRMSAVGRALAQGLPVETGVRIEHLEIGSGGWHLRDDAGEVHAPFAAVLLAVPAPQAEALLGAAPSLQARAAGARLAPCQALMLGFDAPFDPGFDAAFVSASPLSWVARNTSKPGRPDAECWVLHASAEWSESHLELAPDAVAKSLLAAFAEALGRPLPEPRHAVAHRWRYALPTRPLESASEFDPALGLGLCGDWCAGSRLEAAYTSGRHLAARVAGELADG